MKRVNIYSVKLVRESSSLYDLDTTTITGPESAAELIRKVLATDEMTNEHFMMLSLNVKNKVVGVHTLHIGTLNSSVAHPRDAFQHALLNNAASIMIAHNHPSGDPTPSKEDIDVTKRYVDAGKIIGIQVLDHIILGDGNRYMSLKERGYI